MKAIKSGLIIDGTGSDPIEDGVILIENGRVARVGAEAEVKVPEDAEVIELEDQVVLPGLIDPHKHVCPRDSRHIAERVGDPEVIKAFWAMHHLGTDLRTGVTTIRILGHHGWWIFDLLEAKDRGLIAGPRTLNAGKAPKGVHGHGWMGTPMSGAESIRHCFRENFSRGADCAKIFVSGGSHSVTGLYVSFYSREEIEAAVEEAHRFGVRIAGHCHGGIGTTWFIEAGGDSVEHGQVLTGEQMDLMKERGTYLDITLPGELDPTITDRSLEWLERDEKMRARMEERTRLRERGEMPVPREVYRKAMEKGVKYTTNQDGHFGHLPWNIISLVETYDVPPMDAILANTRNAAECCGILDEVGTLEPGKYADLISLRGNPLEDIGNIRKKGMIMVGGRIYDPVTRYWKGLDPFEVIMSQ